MKKLLTSLAIMLSFASCIKNDLAYPDVKACITDFTVEGQISESVYTDKQQIALHIPSSADMSSLKLESFTVTDGAEVLTGAPKVGDSIDLSDTIRIILHLYKDYIWKIYAVKDDSSENKEPQLYNMSFDDWTMVDNAWYLYGADASDAQKAIWGTANKGTSILGKNTTTPEADFVAVAGSGKKAVRLTSIYAAVKFAAGNLFNGQFVGLKGLAGAELAWGAPFTARPTSLHGYCCYQAASVNYADSDHSSLKGTLDEGHIMVMLTDWDAQFHVISTEDKYVDTDNDPGIIGFADLPLTGFSEKYTEFDLPIVYRNERTPKWVVIVAASSKNGDYFTGGEGSTLFLDEFKFIY